MDRWKRRPNGVLINDDSIGYQNARKRVERKAERLNEMEALKKQVNEIAAKADRAAEESRETAAALERKLEEMSKSNDALMNLVKAIAEKVSKD